MGVCEEHRIIVSLFVTFSESNRVVCTCGEGRPNSVARHKCDRVLRDGAATFEYNQVRSDSLRRKRRLLRSTRGYFTKSGYSFEERNHVLFENGGTK